MEQNQSTLLKQRLFRIHISAGIVFSLIMYISLFFGIFAILLPYIKTWEKPSRHFETVNMTQVNYSAMLEEVLKDPDFPKNNVQINLPGFMGDPAVSITHRFVEPIAFNPITQEKLENENKQSHLAKFLNELHYGAPLQLLGRVLFGLVAVGAMLLVITGVILVIKLNFKNKGNNQQALFSKIHVKILTWVFPPFLLIILSGAVMNVGLISSGPMSQILTKGEAKDIDSLVGKVLFPRTLTPQKSNEIVPMLKIQDLLIKAQEINPQLTLKQVKLINWNDKTAQVEISGYNPYKPFLNGGIFNKPTITLSAYTGELINNKTTMDTTWSVFVAEAIFFLHFLFGIDIFSRILMAIFMASCCIAIGFGAMLWLEKKAKKFDQKVTFYHWMGKLSLASMVGIIPATAILFVLQWTLPFDLQDRVLWQQGMFYNTWLATFFWSFYRINSYQASKEFFFIGGLLFLITPFLHFLHIGITPYTLIEQNMLQILGVDIGLLLFAFLLLYISKKLPKNRDQAKIFWKKNHKDNNE